MFSGISASVAEFVTLNWLPAVTLWLAIAVSTGATLTSFTTMVIVSLSLRFGVPLSVTRKVTVLVPGPWASVGVQVNRPFVGSIVAPAGEPGSRLNVNKLVGVSESLAVAVKLNSVPSVTALLPIAARTGAT